MEASEKAKELITEFKKRIGGISFDDHIFHEAKRCAMYCTEEINGAFLNEGLISTGDARKYWDEVKKEIEKLEPLNFKI